LACQEGVSVATDDALDVAARNVVEHPFSHFGWSTRWFRLVVEGVIACYALTGFSIRGLEMMAWIELEPPAKRKTSRPTEQWS
jgi:hypothetical protein